MFFCQISQILILYLEWWWIFFLVNLLICCRVMAVSVTTCSQWVMGMGITMWSLHSQRVMLMFLSPSHLVCTFASFFIFLFVYHILTIWHEELVSLRAVWTAIIFAFLWKLWEKGKASLCLFFYFTLSTCSFPLVFKIVFSKTEGEKTTFFLVVLGLFSSSDFCDFQWSVGLLASCKLVVLWQLVGRITPTLLCPDNKRWQKRQIQYTFYFTENVILDFLISFTKIRLPNTVFDLKFDCTGLQLMAISRVCYSNWIGLDLEAFAANSFLSEQNPQNLQQTWWAKYTVNLFGWGFMSRSLHLIKF